MTTQLAKPKENPPKASKSNDVPWLARLTHPLVFFGATLAVCEGVIGTALLRGTHADSTVIYLCCLMVLVALAAMGTVAFLVAKKPQHLMLTTQDAIGQEIRDVNRVRRVAQIMVDHPKPKTAAELLQLMDKIEAALEGESK